MRVKLWHQITLSTSIVLSFATGAWAESSIFSDYSFAQAKLEARKDGKLLLIDFTASWCPPCQMMESTTWADSAVKEWIKENAIAIQVDVDKDEKTKSALNIEAMPSMVVFTPQNTKEYGRHVGYMSPSELLRWLKKVQTGKSSAVDEKQKNDAGDGQIWERISKARQVQNTGQNAEALTEYVWLWSNVPSDDPAFPGIRNSMLPVEIKRLCSAHPAAKVKFTEIRDEAEKADNREDWLILNGILDDNARTLAWFDKIKTDPKHHETIKKHSEILEKVLFSKNRWADVVTFIYPDPTARLHELNKRAQDMKKGNANTEVSKDFDPLPSMVLLLYGSYVGAGKDAEAKKIEDECLRLNDTPAMRQGLANMAQGMREARASHSKTKK